MGHRESLLEGAKYCLRTKGYARTTARDIVAASNTNLASIGYHFGSKEALLSESLIDAFGDWGKELEAALIAALQASAQQHGGPLDRFETIWDQLVNLFAGDRGLITANFEVFAQIDHIPAVRDVLAGGLSQGKEGLGRLFGTVDENMPEQTALAVGAFYQALVTGIMVQWLIDPEHAPSGHDLRLALQAIAEAVVRPSDEQEPELESV